MAASGGSVVYKLEIDSKNFEVSLKRAEGSVDSFSDKAAAGFDKAGKEADQSGGFFEGWGARIGGAAKVAAAGVVAATAAFVGFSVMGVNTAAQLETNRAGFMALLGSAEAADKAIEMIKRDAATTPFELPGLVTANQLLTAVTKDAGQSERLLLNVGKALATVGKGQPELDRIIINLQQIGAVGKASLMDVRQFAFAGVPIFEMLSKTTGKTGEDLNKFISDGKVTFSLLEQMFNQAGEGAGQYAKAFETQSGTFTQLWSNFMDSINIGFADFVTNSGIFDVVKAGIDGMTKSLEPAFYWLTEVGKAFKEIYGILVEGDFKGLIVDSFGIQEDSPFVDFLFNVRDGAIGLWDSFQKALPAIEAVAKAVFDFLWPSIEDLWTAISEHLMPALRDMWNILAPVLIPLLQTVAVVIGAALVGAIKIGINVVTGLIMVFATLVQWTANVIKGIRDVGQWMLDLKMKINNAFAGAATWLVDAGKNIINGLIKGATSLLSKLGEIFLEKVPNFIREPFKKALGIASPSKIFEGFGENIVQGLQRGVEDSRRSLEGTMSNLSGAVTGDFSASFDKQTSPTTSNNITINLDGIMARSRSDLRDIARELSAALNEEVRAKI